MNGLVDEFEIRVISLVESQSKLFFDLSDRVSHHALFERNPNGIKQYLSIVHRIRNYVKTNNIDILIDIDTIMDMFSVPALMGLNTKLISWEHFNFHETMGNRFRVPVRKHMTKYANCIVTLTKEDWKNYDDYFKGKKKIIQIYNPVEFPEKIMEYDRESKSIISVGRLANQKGFDILLKVAELVFQKHPDWEWNILGEGEERSVLEQFISDKSLSQVKLLGRINNVSDYLHESSIYVMTSRYEGFPLVLIEAKAHNLPIVSFRCKTGPEELVQDGINGYLIDCFNVEDMAEKICYLIENADKRQSFSEKAILDTEKMQYPTIIKTWKDLLNTMES